MADNTPQSVELFHEYHVALARRDEMAAVLSGTDVVDDNVREAYDLARERLDQRVGGYLARTPELIDGAAAIGRTSATAVKQLDILRGILTPDELAARYDPYRAPLERAAFFLIDHCDENDERLVMAMEALTVLGDVALSTTVARPAETVAPSAVETVPAPNTAEEPAVVPDAAAPEQSTTADDTAAQLDEAVVEVQTVPELAPQQYEDAETGAQADRFIANLTAIGTASLSPRQIWEYAAGGHATEYAHYQTGRLIGAINNRLRPNGHELMHNGRRGRGSGYVVQSSTTETVTAKPTEPDREQDHYSDHISIQDALTLAAFFNIYRDAFTEKKVQTIDNSVIDALLAVDQSQGTGQDSDAVRESRLVSIQKMRDLAANPGALTLIIDGLPVDDPRRKVLSYVAEIAGHMDVVESLIGAYNELQMAVTVDKKIGGFYIQGVSRLVRAKDGREVAGGNGEGTSHQAFLAAVAAEEIADTQTAKPNAVLHHMSVSLATLARRHNLRPDRQYMVARLVRIFPELARIETQNAHGTLMVMDAVARVVSQQHGLMTEMGTPEESLTVIYRGIADAYAVPEPRKRAR